MKCPPCVLGSMHVAWCLSLVPKLTVQFVCDQVNVICPPPECENMLASGPFQRQSPRGSNAAVGSEHGDGASGPWGTLLESWDDFLNGPGVRAVLLDPQQHFESVQVTSHEQQGRMLRSKFVGRRSKDSLKPQVSSCFLTAGLANSTNGLANSHFLALACYYNWKFITTMNRLVNGDPFFKII